VPVASHSAHSTHSTHPAAGPIATAGPIAAAGTADSSTAAPRDAAASHAAAKAASTDAAASHSAAEATTTDAAASHSAAAAAAASTASTSHAATTTAAALRASINGYECGDQRCGKSQGQYPFHEFLLVGRRDEAQPAARERTHDVSCKQLDERIFLSDLRWSWNKTFDNAPTYPFFGRKIASIDRLLHANIESDDATSAKKRSKFLNASADAPNPMIAKFSGQKPATNPISAAAMPSATMPNSNQWIISIARV
jgi:hypothetical protein